jgi:ribosome modulation factor
LLGAAADKGELFMDETMEEYRDRITRYYNSDFDEAFAGVKNDFVKASPEQRIQWLVGWDNAMSQETRITREHAEWISKKRELDQLHALLTRAGR